MLFFGGEDSCSSRDPHQVRDPQGGRLGSGISSPRRRTGQTVSARTPGGQSFDPFRPLVRVSIPLFKPSEQGSKIEDRAAGTIHAALLGGGHFY